MSSDASPPRRPQGPPVQEDTSPLRTLLTFIASVAVWVVGLFGLFRLPVVQQYGLVPFAKAQQGIAVALFGVSPTAIVVDVSCTGSDAMALAFGAVLGFPAPWKQRLRAAGMGFLLITVLNTLRIATLSMVVGQRATFDFLHLYAWPGLIVLAAVLYVFRWMQSVAPGGPGSLATPGARNGSSAWGIARSPGWRFGVTATALVGAYFAVSPWLLDSALLQTTAGSSAAVARRIMSALGVTSSVNGNLLMAGNRAWLITPECILTPLIPVYLATILCWPTSTRRRALAVAVAPLLFFSLGVARLLVLALPASLAVHTIALHAFYQVALAVALVGLTVWLTLQGNQPAGGMWRRAAGALSFGIAAAALSAAAIGVAVPLLTAAFGDILRHLGHGYVDGQGALTILPAAQVGLFVALWVASGTSGKSARVATGIGALAIQQLGVALVLGELHTHAGFELPIVAIRAGAIVVPVILVWLLRRDRPLRGNALTVAGVALSG